MNKCLEIIIKSAIFITIICAAFYAGAQSAEYTARSEEQYATATSVQVVGSTSTSELFPLPTPIIHRYKITAYCPCATCCGKSDGITASGIRVLEGVTVAAGDDLPFGTELYIEGVGVRTVQDRGVPNGQLDLFFESHQEALRFGVQWLNVQIIN